MPEPLFAGNTKFRDNMWSYLRDPGAYPGDDPDKPKLVPDATAFRREDEDLMRMIMAMLGSGGWLEYRNKLDAQRKPKETKTVKSDTDLGLEEIKRKKKKGEDSVSRADRIIRGY